MRNTHKRLRQFIPNFALRAHCVASPHGLCGDLWWALHHWRILDLVAATSSTVSFVCFFPLKTAVKASISVNIRRFVGWLNCGW